MAHAAHAAHAAAAQGLALKTGVKENTMQLGKIMILLAIGAAPVFAQKKAAAAKKAPAKAAVPAAPAAAEVPVVATPAPAPEQKPAGGSGLMVSALVWGGYNIPSSESFSRVTSGLTKGGVSGGLEFLAGTSWIRGGFAASYIPISVFEYSGIKDTKAIMPFEGVLNLYLFGFYVGGRGGYVVDVGSTTSSTQAYTKTNGTTFGGQVGYQYSFGPVAIDIGVIAAFAHTEAKTGAHDDYTNVTPRIGIQYTF